MKVVILAGGYGTRISEESKLVPKPMIQVGNRPILWHIMRNFYRFGYDEFIICAGYKGYMINNFFAEYALAHSDVTFDFKNNTTKILKNNAEAWSVTVIDTGIDTMTGGRLKRVEPYLEGERFFLTYGDGICDISAPKLLDFHQKEGNSVTLTTVQPKGRFGVLDLVGDKVTRFAEKAQEDVDWINGGFMVMEPEIFQYIQGDSVILEREPLEAMAKEKKLGAYRHKGFWHCIDTMKDKQDFETYLKEQTPTWLGESGGAV